MALSGADITFDVEFQINATPSLSKLKLTLDDVFTGNGIALSDVVGGWEITGPDGIAFHPSNTTDIDADISLINNVISLPLTAGGAVQEGSYTFQFTALVTGAVTPGTYLSTSYPKTLCIEFPEADFSWESDCFCEPILTLTDATAYGEWTISSRTLSLFPPANAPTSTPITGSGNSVNTASTDVYSGLWTAGLSATVSRDYETHVVSGTITHTQANGSAVSSAQYDLTCDFLCDLRCCIRKAWLRYEEYRLAGNREMAEREMKKWLEATTLYSQAIQEIKNCGVTDNTSQYETRIKEILNCDDCDDCGSEESGLIVPLCSGSGTSYTFVAGTGLTVTDISGTVTYSLTTLNATKLANARLYDVTIDGGSSSFLSVTPSTDVTTTPFTDGFEIAWIGGAIPEATNYIGVQVNLTFTGGGAVLTQSQEVEVGTLYQTPTITAVDGGVASWPNYPALYKVSGFHVGSPGSYKALVERQDITAPGKISVAGTTIDIHPEVLGKDLVSGEFYVGLRFSNGMPATWGYINSVYTSIKVAILIIN